MPDDPGTTVSRDLGVSVDIKALIKKVIAKSKTK